MSRFSLLLSSGLLAGALALGGCPSVSSLTTARTVKPGKHEVHIAPGIVNIPVAMFGESVISYVPTVDFGYRAGLTDMLDLGVRLSSWGNIGLNLKIGLLDSEPVRLSLDPGLGGVFLASGDSSVGYLQFDVPLLVDLYFGESFTLTLGPKYTALYAWASDLGTTGSGVAHMVGATIGFEFLVGNTFAIQPHGGVLFSASGNESVALWTAGIAFKILIGGRDDDTLPQLDDSDLLPEEEVPVDQPVDDGGVEG
jgi:hypothetical protein